MGTDTHFFTQSQSRHVARFNFEMLSVQSKEDSSSRTELDGHANMAVVGKNVLILGETGESVSAAGFNPSHGVDEYRLVHAAIRHDCPKTGKSHILVLYGALSVPSSDNNLIPPFMLREAGWTVNDVPKIHCHEPNSDDHCMFAKDGSKIFLSLRGIFSGFPTSVPSIEEVNQAVNEGSELVMTPDNWDPGSDEYEENEDTLVDYYGNIRETKRRPLALIDSLAPCHQVNWEKEVQDGALMNLVQVSSTFSIDTMVDKCEYREFLADICAAVGSSSPWREDFLWQDSELDAMKAGNRTGITPDELSRVFQIDLPTAKATLRVTTQRVKRSPTSELVRNFSSNDRMLRYRRLKRDFFMDTFFSVKETRHGWDGTSLRGFKMAQIFVSDRGYVCLELMKSLEEIPDAIRKFFKDVGAPDNLISDAHASHKSDLVKSILRQAGTTLRLLEEGSPKSNRAELYVGLIKDGIIKDIKRTGSPKVLWCFCAERKARIHNLTASKLFALQGQTPFFDTFGEEADISRDSQFDWYEWCYFYDKTAPFPTPRETLGRCLGAAVNAGNEMCMWVLKENGSIVPRRTLRRLTPEEVRSDSEKARRLKFDEAIRNKFGDTVYTPPNVLVAIDEEEEPPSFIPYEDSVEEPRSMPELDDELDADGTAAEIAAYDAFIHAEILHTKDGASINGRVVKRAKDKDGQLIGTYDQNPMLNSAVYEVHFDDGSVREYAANAIAESIYAQCDEEGYRYTLLDEIIDYKRKDYASTERHVITRQGQKRLRKDTRGWFLLIRWKNGDEQWVPLKDMKESHPVEVAEFAEAHRLTQEPAFFWWVPYTLKKKKVIINLLKVRKKRKTHKYGIPIPLTVKQAYEFDKTNGNNLWHQATVKEMGDNAVAFEILEDDEPLPVGYGQQSGHMVYDVKLDLTRKARYVLDGHKTKDVEGSTYAGVVSRESVRIALTYAALNGLQVWAADVQNAFLQAPTTQKHYIICGPEFGPENEGKRALIKRALYGGKTAGKDFRDHLRSCMEHLGFTSCLADPDVWYRPALKDGVGKVYEYVLLYVDDCLVVSDNGENILRNEIGRYFTLKESSIGPPNIYLGGQMRQVTLENGYKAWAFGSSKYVRAAVDNVQKYLETIGRRLPERAKTPISTSYRPELDFTQELDSGESSYYQSLIGILRWMVELGRVDICCEVSMMSSHLALPRQGHLDQLYHIFAYLNKHHNSELVFDPSYPSIDESKFQRQDWSSTAYNHEEKEELPSNMPEPRGNGFIMRAFVDADHAGDSMTRKSRSGFLIYLNNAPIYWMSKKQTGIETSSFGSEFTAMKHCCEYIRGLRYRLRMMGIPVMGPTYIYGDNQSVLYNTTLPDSVLKKKSQSIAYHFVREGSARDEWRTAYVNTHENPADILTKPLSGEKREGFVNMILHHIFSYSYVS